MAAVVKGFFVALRTRERGDDQEPGGGAVVFGVARDDIGVFGRQPKQETAKEAVGGGERFGWKSVDEEAQSDGDLGEGDEFGDGLGGL